MLPATGPKDGEHVAYSQWFPKLATVNQKFLSCIFEQFYCDHITT